MGWFGGGDGVGGFEYPLRDCPFDEWEYGDGVGGFPLTECPFEECEYGDGVGGFEYPLAV